MNFSDANADKETLQQIAALLEKFFNKPVDQGIGFSLCIFPKGQAQMFKYVSNAPRKDVLALLHAIQEKYDPIRPLH